MYTLTHNGMTLCCDPGTGALISWKQDRTELVFPGKELFVIGLRSADSSLLERSSSTFCFSAEKCGENAWNFHFSDCSDFPGVAVSVRVCVEAGGAAFYPKISGVPPGFFIEYLEFPYLILDGNGKVFYPMHEGVLVDEPLKYADSLEAEPGWHFYNHYPGWMQMQFMAYFKGAYGLYCGSHDVKHGTKAFRCRKIDAEHLCMSFRLYCGNGDGHGTWEAGYPLVLKSFKGDWMDACDIYRDWVQQNDPTLPPKGQMPSFVNESPVVLLYPVRGEGDDKGAMKTNEYYPYKNAMPVVRRLSEQFDSCLMPLLMHWEGTAPWAPPYVWPPLGGEALLAEYRDALHAEGHYLGVYCSGTAWTQTSSIQKDYSREKQCAEEGLERHMIRGPKGEMDAWICNGPTNQRIGYDMCVSQSWSRETMKTEVKKLADFGIDYAQVFDQNIGGASHFCWSREHDHPPVPGEWQTRNMSSLMEEMCAENPTLVLGCEAGAADAYMKYLPFNDLRPGCWDYSRGLPVPGYAYVFHEYVNNFMGNQCAVHWHLKFDAAPENLLYRTAYAFNSGDLLSVVLRDRGEVNWGWIARWDEYPAPDQESIRTLIRNLNSFRKRYPQFLQYGKMVKPLAEISGGNWTLATTNGPRVLDSFLHASWMAQDGTAAQVVTNFLPECQTVRVEAPGKAAYDLELMPLDAVLLTF